MDDFFDRMIIRHGDNKKNPKLKYGYGKVNEIYNSKNMTSIEYTFFNALREPSVDDCIYIFFYGRQQSMIGSLDSKRRIIEALSKDGSIIIFNYKRRKKKFGANYRFNYDSIIESFPEYKRTLELYGIEPSRCTIVGYSLGTIFGLRFAKFLKYNEYDVHKVILVNPVWKIENNIRSIYLASTLYSMLSEKVRNRVASKYNCTDIVDMAETTDMRIINGQFDSITLVGHSIYVSLKYDVPLFIYMNDHCAIDVCDELLNFIKDETVPMDIQYSVKNFEKEIDEI